MGRWDFQGIEILAGEAAVDAMRALLQAQDEVDGMTIDHHFRGYHVFRHHGKRYLHLGWNNCNVLAYKVLKQLQKQREIISSYSGVGFDTYQDALNPSPIFAADADEDFNPPITFDDTRKDGLTDDP